MIPRAQPSYPGNGRTLTDDAIDVFLSILTNGRVTRDNVGPHKDLLDEFPTSVRRTKHGAYRRNNDLRGYPSKESNHAF